jgi:hypothetical protein
VTVQRRLLWLALACLMLSGPANAQRTPEPSVDNAPDLNVLAQLWQRAPVTPRTARSLVKLYEHCGLFAGPKDQAQWMALYLPTIASTEMFRARRIATAEAGYKRCAKVVANGADVYELRAKWLKAAASGGDLAAKLMLRQLETPTAQTIAGFEAELRAALDSRDPEAIWEAGRSLSFAGFGWGSISATPWPGPPVDALRAVFQLAACEMGLNCGPSSGLVQNLCIRGTCAPQSYAQWLPTFITPAQNQAVQAELPRVLRELKAGRGARLIFR